MAILKTSAITMRPGAGGLAATESREGARRILNLLERLEAPRYDHAEDSLPVSGVTLVFEQNDPIAVPLTLELELDEPRPLLAASENVAAALAELERLAGSAELWKQAREGKLSLEIILGDEEVAAAAYRDQVARCRAYGHSYRPEVWRVVTVEDRTQGGPVKVSRLYVGSIAALRRAFPDADELKRMEASGVKGAPAWEVEAAGGFIVDAEGRKWTRMAIHPAGHKLPDAPQRMRRVGTIHPETGEIVFSSPLPEPPARVSPSTD